MLAEQVIYEQTERAIVQQQQNLAGLWTRVGILLSVAAIATSVLGGQALEDGSVGCWGKVALGTFVAVGILAIAILWPRTWTFRHDTTRLLDAFEGRREPDEMAEMFKRLAKSADEDYGSNEKQLGTMFVMFQISAGLLVAEVALWLLELGLG